MSEQETPKPTDEELLQQVEDELKKLKVSDLLVQMLYTVSSLGYRKLSEQDRDLEQARLAIETLRAVLPVLEGTIGDDVMRDFRQVTANLQLAYAEAARGEPAETKPEPDQAETSSPAPDEPDFEPEDLELVEDEELGGGG
jgi:hypothetical protein